MSNDEPIAERVKELLKKVADMELGGDLDGLILTELEELNKIVYDAALAKRAEATAKKAAFSPSDVSGLSRAPHEQERCPSQEDQDDQR